MAEIVKQAEVRYDADCGMWHYVCVPEKNSQPYEELRNNFGFIAVTAKIGKSSWPTSLLPSGDKKTYFIALPAKIRKAESIKAEDKVDLEFEPRER